MKFLCDKCKTRYSIGDERVRGKILKIRCKNCANVITVREGMADPDAGASVDSGARRNRSTSAQQAISATAAIEKVSLAPPQGALGAAFASQMTKPPPALEEEWYVSMDGNQEGPFSLTHAQKWVAAKPFDAELHCWSEGFDDWLPVDKVSHFRNLRRPRPAARPPTVPPPIPQVHQPLFAATMASIEKAAAAPAPSIAKAPAGSVQRTAAPLAAKANGTGVAAPLPSLRGTGSGPAMPAQHPAKPAVSAGAAALAAAFGTESGESHTTVDSPVFNDEIATTAEPAAAKRLEAKASRPGMSPAIPVVEPFQHRPAVKPIMDDGGDDDDNLEIGEVSRVVKLADIAQMGRSKSTSSNPAMRVGGGTASNPALRPSASNIGRATGMTGSMTKLSPTELGMNVDPSLAALSPAGGPAPDESIVARSFASRHRRGMIVLITVSAVMVLGVIAAVVFVVSGGDNDLPMGLGGTRVIDTSRPEDIVRRALPPPPNAAGSAATTHKKTYRPGQNITTTQPDEPETGPGSRLDAGEVEAMAAKYNEGTKRCYMRAQKGALGFEIADTKKIDVTITVAQNGSISDVKLSKHANNEFGQCLITRIKGWKFRESKGGTFQFALAFTGV